MEIVLVSNFYNHHQAPLSEALSSIRDVEYHFVSTGQMSAQRKEFGWGIENQPDFVISLPRAEDEQGKVIEMIDNVDIAIFGSALDYLLKGRHKKKRITFRYSERFYKQPCPRYQIPLRCVKNFWRFGRHMNDYMLCAGAYTAADLALTHTFIGKTYKWGYFPEMKRYDTDELFSRKHANKKVSILWAGRILGLKHPEAAIHVAERLKKDGYEFELRIIGSGGLGEMLEQFIRMKGLQDCVQMLGSMTPQEVRVHMEESDIFLFTSDFNEGWGAVLNESMNSGCAVVASHAIGSVPFLIEDRVNGMVYQNGNIDDLYSCVKRLMDEPQYREEMGKRAYHTIADTWNAEVAAQRLLQLVEHLHSGKRGSPFEDGPCSIAGRISNDWYKGHAE